MTINRCAINSLMKLDQKNGHILVTMQTEQSALQIGTRELRTQQNELSLKKEGKTQATAVMKLL